MYILADSRMFSSEDERLVKEQAYNIVEIGPIRSHRIVPLIRMEKMKHLLRGFARMIVYETTHKMSRKYTFDPHIKFDPRYNPENNTVIEMREGEFRDGMLNGYGRVMKSYGEAIVGFF